MTGSGVGSSTEPVQATPLRVNAVGFGLAPVRVPEKPRSAAAPVASVRFQSTATALTAEPDCDQVAFQPWATLCPASGMVKRSVHPLTGAPRLVTFTPAWKPPCHWLATVYSTLQPLAATAWGPNAPIRPRTVAKAASKANRRFMVFLLMRSGIRSGSAPKVCRAETVHRWADART